MHILLREKQIVPNQRFQNQKGLRGLVLSSYTQFINMNEGVRCFVFGYWKFMFCLLVCSWLSRKLEGHIDMKKV